MRSSTKHSKRQRPQKRAGANREAGEIPKRNIALVAHDNRKDDLVDWVIFNKGTLELHNLCATGETGKRIMEKSGLKITLLKSGPYGGDMELGAMIANQKLDYMIFFWDPLSSLPHDVDVKALLRISVLYNLHRLQ